MTLRARNGGVRAREREGRQVVIKGRAQPGGRIVASGAIVREARGNVIRVRRLGEVGEVATDTIRRDSLEATAGVTGTAGQRLVRSGQDELGETGVVEARDLPAIRVVTGPAGGREAGGDVIEDAVLLKVTGVAADALRTQTDVSSYRRAAVAGIAGNVRVGADQREAIPMILDLACVHPPTLDGVATLALGAELALMKIGVAIRTAGAGFGEHF